MLSEELSRAKRMLKPTDIKHQKSKDLSLNPDLEEREFQKKIKSRDLRKILYSPKNTRKFMMFGPAREELISRSEKPQKLQLKNPKRSSQRRLKLRR